MLKNYLLTAIRSFRNNKTNSFLNIFGLAIGIACAGLIFLWVENEVNFDGNNTKKDNLYFVMIRTKLDNGINTHGSTPGVLGPALQTDIPGIAATCRTTENLTKALFTIGDKPVYAEGRFAESSIFGMFTIPFVQGSAAKAFTQLYSLVITQKTAKKFFGEQKDIVGKTIRVDGKQDYTITGVVQDLPDNSTLQFEWLAPFQIYYQQNKGAQNWNNYCVSTYAELKTGANAGLLNKQLYSFIDNKGDGNGVSNNHPFLFPMKDWHLHDQFENGVQTGGAIRYVRLFSAIAWIILFIACINFMNLATARSEKRAREVGVRKVLGAGKGNLVAQFMGEALLMAGLATLVAVLIMTLVLPGFNWLVEKELSLQLATPIHILSLMFVAVICGMVAGSYPSLYLSSFNPVFVLKGIRIKAGSASFIRKGLVIVQFTVSIVLITATVIIYRQIQHVKDRDLGFNKNNLIQIDLRGEMLAHFSVIRQDLINTGEVENAALADHPAIYSGNNTTGLDWQGKNPNSTIVISQRLVSPEYIHTVGMQITAGRDFQSMDRVEMGPDFLPLDKRGSISVLVTESFAKLMDRGSALGKWLKFPAHNGMETLNMRVVGVVKDYVFGDMYGGGSPVVFYCIPQFTTMMYVRVRPKSNPEQILSKMADVLKKDNPSFPFEYKFVDEQFNQFFSNEMLISRLSRVFAALAIMISCLGLFGLAAYTAERRTKEIGIRKVLGASATGVAALLSKDFLILVLLSCLIAFPIAWWIMQNWLKDYAYRIEINWWIFAIAGVCACMIAMITVSYQAIRTALANPVTSLRAE